VNPAAETAADYMQAPNGFQSYSRSIENIFTKKFTTIKSGQSTLASDHQPVVNALVAFNAKAF
jgi:hypothetical protein